MRIIAARLTAGYALPAKYVLHTVGPVWRGGDQGEAAQLASCYRHCLALAEQHGIASLAFPAISCGVYGYPAPQAVAIAVSEVSRLRERETAIETVLFACFDEAMCQLYRERLAGHAAA